MKATTRDLMKSLKRMSQRAQAEGMKRKHRAEMLRVIRMTPEGREVLRHYHRFEAAR